MNRLTKEEGLTVREKELQEVTRLKNLKKVCILLSITNFMKKKRIKQGIVEKEIPNLRQSRVSNINTILFERFSLDRAIEIADSFRVFGYNFDYSVFNTENYLLSEIARLTSECDKTNYLHRMEEKDRNIISIKMFKNALNN